MMEQYDLLVIGGGTAGMAVSLAADGLGQRILLAESETELGGVLNQCAHRGFGQTVFGEELTGPAYAARFLQKIDRSRIRVCRETTVLSVMKDRTALLSGPDGLRRIGFERCILAAGCREKTLQSLRIAGTRPAGIYTAGTAQKLMNRGGYGIGRRIVILGTGDVGQIMARHFCEEGCPVVAVIEETDHVGGLEKNRRKCLAAYDVPVILRTTIKEVLGDGRVRGVVIRNLDSGLERVIDCDTVVTAIGLIPDRTLCRDLIKDGQQPAWLRFCGNCEKVHVTADSIVREAQVLAACWK